MFRQLTYLFLIIYSSTSFAINSEEVEQFSQDHAWQKLLYYVDGSKSLVNSKSFFISPDGSTNPLIELQSTISTFKTDQLNKEGINFKCQFPARFLLLQKRWPSEFKNVECREFIDWKKGIDIKRAYIVYSSVYPNNPASMFGHTFLRFDRKEKGEKQITKELLGYSMAFQAITNPNDNAAGYTLKGITGGYDTYLEIKPYYMNIGIYNNGENRDLWEYELDLSDTELDFLTRHAWELSTSGTFKYYFFNKNCSTYLLYFLEAIKPEISFESKKGIFVVPQVTLREVFNKIHNQRIIYRPSIKKKVIAQYEKLNSAQRAEFSNATKDIHSINMQQDVTIIDALIDYWRYYNYQQKTKLSPNEKTLMYTTLSKRSKIESSSPEETISLESVKHMRPELGHKLSRASAIIGNKKYGLNLRFGFHDYFDNETGFDSRAYINFLDINYQYESANKSSTALIKFIDILSLENFFIHIPAISWRAKIDYNKDKTNSSKEVIGEIGIYKRHDLLEYFILPSLNLNQTNDHNNIDLGVNVGGKLILTPKFKFAFDTLIYKRDEIFHKTQAKLSYQNKNYQISPTYKNERWHDIYGIELNWSI